MPLPLPTATVFQASGPSISGPLTAQTASGWYVERSDRLVAIPERQVSSARINEAPPTNYRLTRDTSLMELRPCGRSADL
jgi:hypothetical protein